MLIASQLLESQLKSSNPRQFNYHSTCSQSTACRQRKPPALQVVSSYSGFVTNEVYEECRPFESITYAVVQHLSFHSIKCSARNIAKNANLSDSASKKALRLLRKQRSIVKQDDGTYLFKKLNLDGSTELVDARELVSNKHLGYWFPIDVLKSNRINNQAKRAFALISSLIKSGKHQIEMSYIAKKLKLPRQKTSPLIGSLLNEGLISRHRNHHKAVYSYQVTKKTMGYEKNLSTGRAGNSANYSQPYPKGVPMVTSKGVPMVTTLSIKESNISLIDKRKDRRASDTYKNGENKDIFFMEEEERRRPDVKYSQSYLTFRKVWGSLHLNCREIGSELSMVERGVM